VTAYRIGIDVGGTFTKAALVDGATLSVVGRCSVHTTHDHPRGVAAGVVAVFQQLLRDAAIAPSDVVFLAHSTTQATNALLEGDVAHVGVVGLAPAKAARLARQQVSVEPIELSAGKIIATSNRFLLADEATEAAVAEAIAGMRAEGAAVVVASSAFGVDDTSSESMVRDAARRLGLVATCGHEITKLYGLAARTRTAVINASILPKMIATAELTERSVAEAGIEAPLMIMRGDGGVMGIGEMLRRPALTMLSGPAASVAGALIHTRMSDGIYFEVGGTSTNIGVVKGGRPAVAYARVGRHETLVASLDIRVVGIGGGSLLRVAGREIVDVGPRSAHIAGLPYACFADPAPFANARLALFEPSAGDGPGFVAIETASGERFALTPTCAANALGLASPDMHAFAEPDAARRAFAPLAAHLGTGVDDAARMVLDRAGAKILPVLDALAAEYRLDSDQQTLIGVGGGIGALVRHVAAASGRRFVVPRDAEIISSIGAALAMVREVVERVVPNATPADLLALRTEALEAAQRLGASRDSIEVSLEVDRPTGRVRAIAVGAVEMRSKGDTVDEAEARAVAALSLGVPPDALVLRAETPFVRLYATANDGWAAIRAIDRVGRIRVGRSRAIARVVRAQFCAALLTELHTAAFAGAYVLHGDHVLDLCDLDAFEQALALAEQELRDVAPETPVIVIWLPETAAPALAAADP
jgi:N-methylhydantoinase A/oxoprolinase/acetone carboxylase beta subunit